MNQSKILLSGLAVAMLFCTGAASAGSVSVFLDEDHQGRGNKGTEFRPVDSSGELAGFVMTAMSSIDDTNPFDMGAEGLTGTVSIDRHDNGAGVQTEDGRGSKLISGGGAHNDEQLMFTFDSFAVASSIELALTEFDAGDGLNDADDTVIFITYSDSTTQTLTELDYLSAFRSTGRKRGFIDFSGLDLDGDQIKSLWVRETNGHMGVNGMGFQVVPLPPAALLGLVGLGIVGVARHRKHS